MSPLLAHGHYSAALAVGMTVLFFLFKKKLFFFNIYLSFERQRQNMSWEGDRERGGVTDSEAGSRLRAVSTEPDAGLEPMNHEIMT